MTNLIPGGRAPGALRDQRILNEEDAARRAREAPGRDNWVLRTLPLGLDLTDQTILTANLLRLYYLGEFLKGTQLWQARLNITTSAAAQTVRAALYTYDDREVKGRRLRKQADSEAVFLAGTAGVQTVQFPGAANVTPGRLFLGIKASNDAVGVAGLGLSTVSRALPVYTFQDGSGTLVPELQFSQLSKSYTERVLDALYISPDAAQVL